MVSCPPNIATSLSKPNARPPCGGAPYSKASIKKPNCALASSSENPRWRSMIACVSLSCIRIDPPPISLPLSTRS